MSNILASTLTMVQIGMQSRMRLHQLWVTRDDLFARSLGGGLYSGIIGG